MPTLSMPQVTVISPSVHDQARKAVVVLSRRIGEPCARGAFDPGHNLPPVAKSAQSVISWRRFAK